MLMRIQEIQESKIRRIQVIERRMEIKPIMFEIKAPEIFEPNLYYNSDKENSKYFNKPKNNYKK